MFFDDYPPTEEELRTSEAMLAMMVYASSATPPKNQI
jgi:hypothetical protein